MTISYNLDVSSIKWTYVMKILFRWRASLWKSVYLELIVWSLGYYFVMMLYRYGLDAKEQRTFELLAEYCDKRLDYFPLMLMLGFFVATVVDRWKNMFANIGFIDNVAIYVSTTIVGVEEELKIIRRNIIRYCCLTQVLVLRDISMRVRKRFPNLEAVVEAGFLMPHELKQIQDLESLHPKYWLPIQWVFILLSDLKRKNKMEPEGYVNMLMGEVINYRNCLQNLCNFDYVPIPLAYPQTIALAIRFYFLIALISRQYLIHRTSTEPVTIDFYVPFMTIFQFIFYIGWLKVAEALLNPLGEDDDDFESNYIIDRNISIGMAIVDDAYGRLPEQLPDKFKTDPLYSEQSAQTPIHPLIGSAAQAGVKNDEDEIKMVPHADYEKKQSSVQPPPQNSTIQVNNNNSLKKRKAFTQPEISKKWSISLFNRQKRIPTLEEVQVIDGGKRIDYGPKKDIPPPPPPADKDAPVTFSVPSSQETERQTERNKQMYLSSITEDKEDGSDQPPPVCHAETLPAIKDQSVQLLTAFTAAHFFDKPKFFKEADRVLIENGVIAFVGYYIPEPSLPNSDDKSLTNLMNSIANHPELTKLESPLIATIKNRYRDIKFPDNYEYCYQENICVSFPAKAADLIGYIQTWSFFQAFLESDKSSAEALLVQFERDLKNVLKTDDLKSTEIYLNFNYFIAMGRKIA